MVPKFSSAGKEVWFSTQSGPLFHWVSASPCTGHMSVNWSLLILVTSLQSSDHTHIALMRKPRLRKSENLPKDDGATKCSQFPLLGLSLGESSQNTHSECPLHARYLLTILHWSLGRPNRKSPHSKKKSLRFRVDFSKLYWLASVKAAQIPGVVFSFCFVFIEVDLIYNIVLGSGIQWSGLVIYVCVYMYVHMYILYIYV